MIGTPLSLIVGLGVVRDCSRDLKLSKRPKYTSSCAYVDSCDEPFDWFIDCFEPLRCPSFRRFLVDWLVVSVSIFNSVLSVVRLSVLLGGPLSEVLCRFFVARGEEPLGDEHEY